MLVTDFFLSKPALFDSSHIWNTVHPILQTEAYNFDQRVALQITAGNIITNIRLHGKSFLKKSSIFITGSLK